VEYLGYSTILTNFESWNSQEAIVQGFSGFYMTEQFRQDEEQTCVTGVENNTGKQFLTTRLNTY